MYFSITINYFHKMVIIILIIGIFIVQNSIYAVIQTIY